MHKGFGFIVDDFGQEELNGHDGELISSLSFHGSHLPLTVFVHHTAIQRVNNVEVCLPCPLLRQAEEIAREQNFKSLVKGEPVEYNIHIRVHDGKLGYLASDVTGTLLVSSAVTR